MKRHDRLSDDQVREQIASGEISFAGHRRHRIYGRLDCSSGRRYMARVNRVFFVDEDEATAAGYRPCSRCMPERYAQWRMRAAPQLAPALRAA